MLYLHDSCMFIVRTVGRIFVMDVSGNCSERYVKSFLFILAQIFLSLETSSGGYLT